jgi:hypothetical protein
LGGLWEAGGVGANMILVSPYALCVISDNALIGAGGNGIEVGAGTLIGGMVPPSCTINNNSITGNGQGILIDSTATALGVHDNMLTSSNNVAIQNNVTNTATHQIRIHDNSGYNPVGYTAGTSTGTTGTVITAGASPETHYIFQTATFNAAVLKCTTTACGTSTTICTVAAATVPCVIQLGPNESYKVTFTTTQPTYTKDVH